MIKSELLKVLNERGLLTHDVSVELTGAQSSESELRFRELEVEMRWLELRERELNYEKELKEKQMEFEYRKMMLEKELQLKEIESQRTPALRGSFSDNDGLDLNKWIRLVPPFNEKDVDCYFVMFERAANMLKWPKDVWSLLLQSVLTGKAQDKYASMASETCLDYDQVKSAVLRAYELVPGAYRQKRKRDGQTFCEFGREKEALFDRWCQSTAVHDFKDLRNLVLLEKFKNCLPENICTYLNEQKVKTVADAAVLAEEYALTHQENERSAQQFKSFVSQSRVQFQGDEKPRETSNWKGKVCFYCKKPGHTINQCFVLNKKSKTPKSVTLVQTGSSPVLPVVHSSPSFAPVTKEGLDSNTLFLIDF